MLYIKSVFFTLLLAVLLAGCATSATTAPAPTATVAVPTSTPLPPTQAEPTKTPIPVIPGIQVDIQVETESLPTTITGTGNVGIILTNTESNDPLVWLPLVNSLESNENLRVVTFVYRDGHSTSAVDTRAVFDYLQAEGVDRVICMGSYYGAGACAALRSEPEIAGMVFFPSPIIPNIEEGFPKLFLTADADSSGYLGPLQRAYDQAAEPKVFKSYPSGRHGPALFTDPEIGTQVLADIVAFIDEIVSSQ